MNSIALILLLSGMFFIWASSVQLPDVNSFNSRVTSQSTKFFDRTGEILLFNIQENVRRSEVPLSKISPYLQKATVAIEDDRFYEHNGIRPVSFLRALLVNAASLEFSQGGSTITQQVVKNSLLTNQKSVLRKMKEWVLAVKLEKVISKDQILEIYLNESPYGGNIYGAEEASQAFFGVSANNLSLAQSAYLASLPQAPSYYSPYGNHNNELSNRKNLVLERMYENKYINETEFLEAKSENVEFKLPVRTGIIAPHFVFYLRGILEEKYGKRALEEEGLKVVTTIDVPMQQKAEEIVKKYALSNEKAFNAENAGLVAIDPKTGQILAMVGSRDYFDKDIDGNVNITLAKRQPGSSFKPFVYATAFKKGYTPETVLFDVPTEFSTRCSDDSQPLNSAKKEDCYSPENYDLKFRGPVNLRDALAQSLNVIAVKVLYLAGLNDVLETAKDVGITTLNDPSRYGLTLVLGGGEVTLLELTGAYGSLANDGIKNVPTGILSIEDSSGAILEAFEAHQNNALPPDVARTVSDILSDDVARTPLFGPRSNLYFPGRDVAAKTGTTNDYRDAWVVGYTPSLVIGAWAGNNDNRPMEKKLSGQIIVPLWHEFMAYSLPMFPSETFRQALPQKTESLPPILRGVWQGGEVYSDSGIVVQNVHTILYWLDKNNPQSGVRPQKPENDPQYSHWEYGIRRWAESNGYGEIGINPSGQQSGTDGGINVNSSNGTGPYFKITNLDESNIFPFSKSINFNVIPQKESILSRVEVYFNGTLFGNYNQAPFYVSISPREIIGSVRENNNLTIIGFDSLGNKNQSSLNLKVNLSN